MREPLRRSVLFVGGLALDGMEPAFKSGTDIVCIDIEDAVPPDRKDRARTEVLSRLAAVSTPPGIQLIVRVNSLRSIAGIADIHALITTRLPALGGILLPKTETEDEVRLAGQLIDDARLNDLALYAIIETTDGAHNCYGIAKAHPRLKALFFGGFDLSTALGSAMAWEPLLYARSRVVHAAASGGIQALDSPFPDVADADGLKASALRVKALGMVGKAAKHASQIPIIRDVFTPTDEELSRARAIVKQFDADPTKPLMFEGKLVELPTVKRLRQLADAYGIV